MTDSRILPAQLEHSDKFPVELSGEVLDVDDKDCKDDCSDAEFFANLEKVNRRHERTLRALSE